MARSFVVLSAAPEMISVPPESRTHTRRHWRLLCCADPWYLWPVLHDWLACTVPSWHTLWAAAAPGLSTYWP